MAFVLVQASALKCNKVSLLFRKNSGILHEGFLRAFNNSSTISNSNNNSTKEISKSVFISQSRDIYTNLALEDWLYKNFDFTNHHVMLLWKNNPCVVIGRHQNPWIEANIANLENYGIDLARRNSGGGTVYHDQGNLNITFFAPRERYNRKQNLELIAKTLEKEWCLHPEINKKEDIVLDNNFKISGTASKLGRPNSYHHCTLLVDVDKNQLAKTLKTDELSVMTTATKSVPAPTVNLTDLHSGITMDRMMAAVGWAYLRTSPITQKDEGWNYVQKQRGFQMINPTDEWFPGLDQIKTDFNGWNWTFGKTPKFSIFKNFELSGPTHGVMRLCLLVDKGIVTDVSLHLPDRISWNGLTGTIPLVSTVTGQKFKPDLFSQVENAVRLQPIKFIEEPEKRIDIAARI